MTLFLISCYLAVLVGIVLGLWFFLCGWLLTRGGNDEPSNLDFLNYPTRVSTG